MMRNDPKIAGNALKLLTSRGPRSDARQLHREDLERVEEVPRDKQGEQVQRHCVCDGVNGEVREVAVLDHRIPKTTMNGRKATPHDTGQHQRRGELEEGASFRRLELTGKSQSPSHRLTPRHAGNGTPHGLDRSRSRSRLHRQARTV